ncbi:hypothetical protein SNEBB_010868 [Seison nebaliae]|nr:hypothetical protein SNEBB_010868 [Seison nebaliae]
MSEKSVKEELEVKEEEVLEVQENKGSISDESDEYLAAGKKISSSEITSSEIYSESSESEIYLYEYHLEVDNEFTIIKKIVSFHKKLNEEQQKTVDKLRAERDLELAIRVQEYKRLNHAAIKYEQIDNIEYAVPVSPEISPQIMRDGGTEFQYIVKPLDVIPLYNRNHLRYEATIDDFSLKKFKETPILRKIRSLNNIGDVIVRYPLIKKEPLSLVHVNELNNRKWNERKKTSKYPTESYWTVENDMWKKTFNFLFMKSKHYPLDRVAEIKERSSLMSKDFYPITPNSERRPLPEIDFHEFLRLRSSNEVLHRTMQLMYLFIRDQENLLYELERNRAKRTSINKSISSVRVFATNRARFFFNLRKSAKNAAIFMEEEGRAQTDFSWQMGLIEGMTKLSPFPFEHNVIQINILLMTINNLIPKHDSNYYESLLQPMAHSTTKDKRYIRNSFRFSVKNVGHIITKNVKPIWRKSQPRKGNVWMLPGVMKKRAHLHHLNTSLPIELNRNTYGSWNTLTTIYQYNYIHSSIVTFIMFLLSIISLHPPIIYVSVIMWVALVSVLAMENMISKRLFRLKDGRKYFKHHFFKITRFSEHKLLLASSIGSDDTIHLTTGEMVPTDIFVIKSKDLLVDISSLIGQLKFVEYGTIERRIIPTGEQIEAVSGSPVSLLESKYILFRNSKILQGSCEGVVIKPKEHSLAATLSVKFYKELFGRLHKFNDDHLIETVEYLIDRASSKKSYGKANPNNEKIFDRSNYATWISNVHSLRIISMQNWKVTFVTIKFFLFVLICFIALFDVHTNRDDDVLYYVAMAFTVLYPFSLTTTLFYKMMCYMIAKRLAIKTTETFPSYSMPVLRRDDKKVRIDENVKIKKIDSIGEDAIKEPNIGKSLNGNFFKSLRRMFKPVHYNPVRGSIIINNFVYVIDALTSTIDITKIYKRFILKYGLNVKNRASTTSSIPAPEIVSPVEEIESYYRTMLQNLDYEKYNQWLTDDPSIVDVQKDNDEEIDILIKDSSESQFTKLKGYLTQATQTEKDWIPRRTKSTPAMSHLSLNFTTSKSRKSSAIFHRNKNQNNRTSPSSLKIRSSILLHKYRDYKSPRPKEWHKRRRSTTSKTIHIVTPRSGIPLDYDGLINGLTVVKKKVKPEEVPLQETLGTFIDNLAIVEYSGIFTSRALHLSSMLLPVNNNSDNTAITIRKEEDGTQVEVHDIPWFTNSFNTYYFDKWEVPLQNYAIGFLHDFDQMQNMLFILILDIIPQDDYLMCNETITCFGIRKMIDNLNQSLLLNYEINQFLINKLENENTKNLIFKLETLNSGKKTVQIDIEPIIKNHMKTYSGVIYWETVDIKLNVYRKMIDGNRKDDMDIYALKGDPTSIISFISDTKSLIDYRDFHLLSSNETHNPSQKTNKNNNYNTDIITNGSDEMSENDNFKYFDSLPFIQTLLEYLKPSGFANIFAGYAICYAKPISFHNAKLSISREIRKFSFSFLGVVSYADNYDDNSTVQIIKSFFDTVKKTRTKLMILTSEIKWAVSTPMINLVARIPNLIMKIITYDEFRSMDKSLLLHYLCHAQHLLVFTDFTTMEKLHLVCFFRKYKYRIINITNDEVDTILMPFCNLNFCVTEEPNYLDTINESKNSICRIPNLIEYVNHCTNNWQKFIGVISTSLVSVSFTPFIFFILFRHVLLNVTQHILLFIYSVICLPLCYFDCDGDLNTAQYSSDNSKKIHEVIDNVKEGENELNTNIIDQFYFPYFDRSIGNISTFSYIQRANLISAIFLYGSLEVFSCLFAYYLSFFLLTGIANTLTVDARQFYEPHINDFRLPKSGEEITYVQRMIIIDNCQNNYMVTFMIVHTFLVILKQSRYPYENIFNSATVKQIFIPSSEFISLVIIPFDLYMSHSPYIATAPSSSITTGE